MERKEFAGLELKNESTGEVVARVATLGVVDKDRDWIEPGAVPIGGVQVLMSSYAHNVVTSGQEPVGWGVLRSIDGTLRFDGKVFLSTQRGRETHALLKEMPRELGQWSFGYETLKTAPPSRAQEALGAKRVLVSILPVEVSPVFRGSGVSTATLAVKASPNVPVDQAELRRIAAKLDPREQGKPLPDRHGALIDFAAKSFAIPRSQRPPIRVVPRFRIRDNSDGCYFVDHNVIHVAGDLKGADLEATLLHEYCHAYEARKSWAPNEGFAALMEKKLLDQWRDSAPSYLSH